MFARPVWNLQVDQLFEIKTAHATLELNKVVFQPFMTCWCITSSAVSETNDKIFTNVERKTYKVTFEVKNHVVLEFYDHLLPCDDLTVLKLIYGKDPELFHDCYSKMERRWGTGQNFTGLHQWKLRTEWGVMRCNAKKIFNAQQSNIKIETN